MTVLRQAAAAAAAGFAPGRPPHTWTCAVHGERCPVDSPRWRAVHAEIAGMLADLESPAPPEDFTAWLARTTAGCRPVDHRGRTVVDPSAVRQTTQDAADRARAWLDDHPEGATP